MSKIYVAFINAKREKNEIKSKIRLIYNSKLKYDVIGRDLEENMNSNLK